MVNPCCEKSGAILLALAGLPTGQHTDLQAVKQNIGRFESFVYSTDRTVRIFTVFHEKLVLTNVIFFK